MYILYGYIVSLIYNQQGVYNFTSQIMMFAGTSVTLKKHSSGVSKFTFLFFVVTSNFKIYVTIENK